MDYETLDTIADAYIPILLGLFLAGLCSRLYNTWPNYGLAAKHSCYLLSLLVVSYSLMFFDNAVGLWPALGLDYSTHTAVALSLVFALCALFTGWWPWVLISMSAYIGLMLYQQYHSLLDIVSTGAVIAIFSVWLFKSIIKKN